MGDPPNRISVIDLTRVRMKMRRSSASRPAQADACSRMEEKCQ